MDSKSFLDLPAELRIEIYNLALARPLHAFGGYAGLYYSNRKIHDEMQYELLKILESVKEQIESIRETYTFHLEIKSLGV